MATVVIGVDDSPASRRAVEFAIERYKVESFALVLVHIINWSPFSFNTPEENEHRHARREAELEAAFEQVITPMKLLAEGAGMAPTIVVRHGNPADGLIGVSREQQADHIIVGRAGERGLREHVFGSVASRLVQHAPVPVTVVP